LIFARHKHPHRLLQFFKQFIVYLSLERNPWYNINMFMKNPLNNISKNLVILSCCFIVLLPYKIYAASITITWYPSEPGLSDVAGYKIYYGTESGNYTFPPIDAGNVTSYTIDGLDEDEIYFFAVTAYASGGEESAFSPEVSTLNEFTGTAQLFSRKPGWNSCEMEDESFNSVDVYLSFNILLSQFIFKPEDTLLTCDEGVFIQNADGTIEAKCLKTGPLFGIITIYTFEFEGLGNVALKNLVSMSGDVFNSFNSQCPRYVINIDNIMPMQQ